MRWPLPLIIALLQVALAAGTAQADGGLIMPLSEVQPGMDCTGQTVVQGVTISSFNVHVIDIVASAGGARILVRVSGPAVDGTGVAQGMSGSPVYCPDSSGNQANAGAISAGVGAYGNNVALVTPIQQMLSEPVRPPSGAPRLTARTHPLLGPLTVGGLSPVLLSILEQAGQRVGRAIVAAPPAPGVAAFPVQNLVPGASVATSYSVGTITTGAVGTVTYRDGSNVWAFGHELDGAGRRSLLLEDAYVYDVINNPDALIGGSSKLASPGHPLGTLTSDTPAAVIGELGPVPTMIPVDVTAQDLDTGRVINEDTQVADETDVGLPLGTSMLDTVAPLAVGQAAIDVYDGAPANESGHFCLSISIRESPRPVGFCKRYVGIGGAGDMGLAPPELSNGVSTDVGSAFGILEAVRFAQLHVTRVRATIYAQRGLSEASIVSARAPRVVRTGRSVLVRLRVRMYRGGVRTVSFRLRIPRAARRRLSVVIKGPSFSVAPPSGDGGGGPGGLVPVLTIGLGGPSSNPGPPPPTIAAVSKSIAGIAHYDGLVASIDGGKPARVYSNPKLLISGRTMLPMRAVR